MKSFRNLMENIMKFLVTFKHHPCRLLLSIIQQSIYYIAYNLEPISRRHGAQAGVHIHQFTTTNHLNPIGSSFIGRINLEKALGTIMNNTFL